LIAVSVTQTAPDCTCGLGSRRRLVTAIAAVVLGLGLMFASGAAGATVGANPVIQDCLNHPGGLTHQWTVAQLDQALAVMPAETKEYTDCPDVINRARLAALHGLKGSGSGGGGGSFLPTPVLIVLLILILAAVTFGALAVRRRRGPAGGPGGGGPRA
jgi:hypothetical protein